MVLESSEPKENDKFFKKIKIWGGFGPPKNLKMGGFRGAETTKILKTLFFKIFIIFFGL